MTARTEPAASRATTLRVFSVEPIGARGGCEHYDVAFADALTRRPGVEVVWVTADTITDVGGRFERWSAFAGIYGDAPEWRRGLHYARGLGELLRRVVASAREVPTVVDQQWVLVPPLEYAVMRAAQHAGVPWFITPHEAVPYGREAKDAGFRRTLYRRADGMFALSRASAAQMREILGPSDVPVHLTPHGHKNAYRGPEAEVSQAEARRRLALSPTGPLLLFVGELRDVKGVDVLLRAMPQVLEACPDARLLISSSLYRASAEPYVRLLSDLGLSSSVDVRWKWVPDEELGLLHRASDVVVLPYRAASQSGACLTAYAYRRPVVASAVGGLGEQVADGVTGRSVPPGDPAALARALVELLADRAALANMGETARAWAARELDWDAIAVSTERAFREALGRGARSRGGG